MAQSLKGYLDLRHITGLSGADLEINATSAKGFAAGQPIWMFDAFGPKLYMLIQNRMTSATAFTRGQLVSRVSTGINGVTIVSASTGTTSSFPHGSTVPQTNQFVGALASLVGTASAAGSAVNDGEISIVVSNTTAQFFVDPRYPYSAAVSTQNVQLVSVYGARLAQSGDYGTTALGVVIGQNGISTGRFGFVQVTGVCPRVDRSFVTTGATEVTPDSPLYAATTGQVGATVAGVTTSKGILGRGMVTTSTYTGSAQMPAFLYCAGFALNTSSSAVAAA